MKTTLISLNNLIRAISFIRNKITRSYTFGRRFKKRLDVKKDNYLVFPTMQLLVILFVVTLISILHHSQQANRKHEKKKIMKNPILKPVSAIFLNAEHKTFPPKYWDSRTSETVISCKILEKVNNSF